MGTLLQTAQTNKHHGGRSGNVTEKFITIEAFKKLRIIY